ncbi:MAG: Ldh family oxidoreductase [candidate division NC10 bacterium]|nr:Ldh family oxidoreductase [candidate division NC10 bacterium]
MKSVVLVKPEPLSQFCRHLFQKVGVPMQDAQVLMDNLIEADLRGVDTHGVTRIAIYIERLQSGAVKAKPQIKVLKETPTSALLDGDHGLGQVISAKAMEMAIEKAKAGVIGLVGVRNSTHNGAMAHFAMMAVKQDLIGIALTNTVPLMAVTGGNQAMIGNNPLAIAAPAGSEKPVVFDMACSIAARGKIILAAKKGEKIPLGWAIDKEGLPTQDAKAALEGLILPVGGHKGYGLALMVDVLSGVLTGAHFGPSVGPLYNNPGVQGIGHLMAAIRIEAFLPLSEFKARMDQMIRDIKNSKKAKGVEEIFLPGEIEMGIEAKRRKEGIPLSRAVYEELCGLGEELGVKPDFA